jgi:hypothetical protein
MRSLFLRLAFGLGTALAVSASAWADEEADTMDLQALSTPVSSVAAAPAKPCDPYQDYSCFDAVVGNGVFERLANYYKLEWGQAGAPTDPSAPASRRDGWPGTPQTTPPMPFTEWPYGGSSSLGVTRPASIDSPLMVAIANTALGKLMSDGHIQFYGWVNGGANVSTSYTPQGGNAPSAYSYRPNTAQLDQAVVYLERLPDTVQSDHIDWGFRLSAIYGENYRYTTAYGLASYQLLNHNNINGYDFPMLYAEMFIPQIGEGGLMLRLGRYISVPDIEAQLAPNNYMYSHSMTYSFDNYTNTGLLSTLGLTKTLFLQFGIAAGTEALPNHLNARIPNPYPNPIYPDNSFKKDPGSQPTYTACFRYNTQTGNDNLNVCANGINNGQYGYNNLQWYGLTAYHKFDSHWHVSYEAYYLHQNNVPNLNNPEVQTINANGGTPFTAPASGILFNAPDEALCKNSTVLTCTAGAYGTVAYLNYSPDPLNNISLRPEFFWDKEGQRTGAKTRYTNLALGWQHWLSPQIELRPEIAYYRALNGDAFNGNGNLGIAPNKDHETLLSGDVIIHF